MDKKWTDCAEGEVNSTLRDTSTNLNKETVTNFNSLTCLQTNARSILNKHNELQLLVLQHNPHIIGITETWLDSSNNDSEITLDDYNIFRNDRTGSCGGGVLLHVHKSLICSPCQNLDTFNFIKNLCGVHSLHQTIIHCQLD